MAMNDPIGDMLTRIRNAQMRNKSKVSTPGSKLRAQRARRAEERRLYPRLCQRRDEDGRSELEIELKYYEGEPVIREIDARLEAGPPGLCRRSMTLPRINNGLGISILSTPKGVMADHDARDENVGGEVLCTVF